MLTIKEKKKEKKIRKNEKFYCVKRWFVELLKSWRCSNRKRSKMMEKMNRKARTTDDPLSCSNHGDARTNK